MKTKRMVLAALLAALTCVATMIIKIPSPMKGYLNLGDCVVLIAGWMLSPTYGFIAAFINVPANAMQGVAGIVIGTILMKAIEKSTIKFG